uniref:Homeobox domain-containing protein n=1 Tax=Periophthalmus magnuspinnatus TaxID=409849 RepID=A0A3B3ZUF4_9GOBI
MHSHIQSLTKITNFSIEHILSPDLGTKLPQDRTPSSCYMANGTFGSYFQCAFYPSYPAVSRVTDTQAYPYDAACNGAQRNAEEKQVQQQWKPRVRTVFRESQLQRLEELFEHTRYPAPEMRAEMARSTDLSEETVRIWFKNHRARRKRQTSSPQNRSGTSGH